MQQSPPSPVLGQLVQYLRDLDQERAIMLEALKALGGTYPKGGSPYGGKRKTKVVEHPAHSQATTPHSSKPAKAKGHHSRNLDTALYTKTLQIIRASKQPISTKELRHKLKAQKFPHTSIYYHLAKALKLGEVSRDSKGLYSHPVHTPAE